jgi:hypothetical protein
MGRRFCFLGMRGKARGRKNDISFALNMEVCRLIWRGEDERGRLRSHFKGGLSLAA